jgi:hypothetical protein
MIKNQNPEWPISNDQGISNDQPMGNVVVSLYAAFGRLRQFYGESGTRTIDAGGKVI